MSNFTTPPEGVQDDLAARPGATWAPPLEELQLVCILLHDAHAARAVCRLIKPLYRHQFQDAYLACIYGAISTVDVSDRAPTPQRVAHHLDSQARDPLTPNPEICRLALSTLRDIADKVPAEINDPQRPQDHAQRQACRLAVQIQKTYDDSLPPLAGDPEDEDEPKPSKKPRKQRANKPESTSDASDFSLDEIGNGQRFAARYGADMRYCPVRETWLIFSKRWQLDEKGESQLRAKQIARDWAIQAAAEPNDDKRARLLKHALTLTKRATRETMLKDAASEPGMTAPPEDFDAHLHLFNLANGTLNLKTFEIYPHRAEDLLTHYSPVVFDPDAKCPTWSACMERWIPDAATRDYMQETAGLSLSGIVNEEFFNFLYGDGDNGKSTFLRVLELICGSYWHKTQAETIMQARDQKKAGAPSPELLALKAVRLLTVHEIDSKHRMNATLIKDLTGRDSITARGVFDKRLTTFIPQFTLWMFGNGKPQIVDNSGGMWRRVRLINFGESIPKEERDPQLSNKLSSELPGILNWALEGLRRVNERRGVIVVPQAVMQATEAYRAEQDPLTDFLKERCVIDPNYNAGATNLWNEWCEWCKETGEKEGSQRSFGLELTRRKFEKYTNNGVRRRGIGLRSEKGDQRTLEIEGQRNERNERNQRNEIPAFSPIENAYAETLLEQGSEGSEGSVNSIDSALQNSLLSGAATFEAGAAYRVNNPSKEPNGYGHD